MSTSFAPVDYDRTQHQAYSSSRSLPSRARTTWANAFTTFAPELRPLRALDLGSGTGRFTPLLAELFDSAIGVEPSSQMRSIAQDNAQHPSVTYLSGAAEQIPAEDRSFDFVLMFLSLHHVQDRRAAAREIERVTNDGGRLLIRSTFSDRMPNIEWHEFFPSARAVEQAVFPTLRETTDLFSEVGFRPISIERVRETFAENLTDYAGRLRTKSISTFEHLSEAEIIEGFARLDAAVASDDGSPIVGDSDLLVMER